MVIVIIGLALQAHQEAAEKSPTLKVLEKVRASCTADMSYEKGKPLVDALVEGGVDGLNDILSFARGREAAGCRFVAILAVGELARKDEELGE